jgi:alpha-1,6-mannosyltransferase
MVMVSALLKSRFSILIALASAILYFIFAYHLVRTDSAKLLLLYGILFFLCYALLCYQKQNFTYLALLGIFFRLIFLCSLPNLSQDFYRFIWDGQLVLEGINPYLYLPEDIIKVQNSPMPDAQALYEGMGALSASHYSNYPPLSQLIFAIAALFSNSAIGAVIMMRIMVIAADIGVLYFGKKLLEALHLPVHAIFWYFLHPFIIVELIGNLHFEGIMLFFCVWSLYALHQHKIYLSAVLLAGAVSVKLIPLLLLPLFLQRLGWKKFIVYSAIVIMAVMLTFFPFLSKAFLTHYSETIALWFTNFEFNASWYYLVREIGFNVKGYNIINAYGSVMPWIVIGFVVILTCFRKNKTLVQLISAMVLALSLYYFTSTTVHPWYIAFLVGLSVFINYTFPIVWSVVIMLSYCAYAHTPFYEHLGLIILEYSIVYGIFLWEIFAKRLPIFLFRPYKNKETFANNC